MEALASAILFAVNYDRQKSGLPPVTSVDDTSLRLMNPVDWQFANIYEHLAFSVVMVPPTFWQRYFGIA